MLVINYHLLINNIGLLMVPDFHVIIHILHVKTVPVVSYPILSVVLLFMLAGVYANIRMNSGEQNDNLKIHIALCFWRTE